MEFGKSIICSLIAKNIKNKKILIIDDNINGNINTIFGVKIKNNITKINKNIDLFTIKNKSKKTNINYIINNNKKAYDLILIDLNKEDKEKNIIYNSDIILFITEANLINIEKSKIILEKYINIFKIKKEKINIIFNKVTLKSINIKLLERVFDGINIIGKINFNKNFDVVINSNLKIIDKKINKEIIKINNGEEIW